MGLLKTLAVLWLIRQGFRLARLLLAAAVLVLLWPVTTAAVLTAASAWLAGWPPARLYRATAWSAPVAAVWLLAAALRDRTWQAVGLAPVNLWHQASLALVHCRVIPAVVLAAPLAVPLGLLTGGVAWQARNTAMAAGAAGRHAFAPAAFDARQWQRQARSARGRLAAPGPFALVTSRGMVPAGAVICAVGRSWTPVLEIPVSSFARHMVIIGASGTGKTNLMIRLWTGWLAATLAAARRGRPRPLLVALDCKGGRDARAKADRTRRVLRGVGAGRVAVWPDDATLNLWALPPEALAVLLFQMIEHGDGSAAYYADITQAVLTLAVTAPPAPPRNAAEFSPGWTRGGWKTPGPLTRIGSGF